MKLINVFIRSYPWQSGLLIAVLLAAGVADGLGLSALLPTLNIAFEAGPAGELSSDQADDQMSRFVLGALESVGLTPSLGLLLGMIVAGITLKNVLVFIAAQRIGYLAADVATALRMDLLQAVTASRWAFYVRQSAGQLANSMATEAWRASQAYVHAVQLLVLVIEALVLAVLALLVSWKATLLCLAASVVILLLSHRFVRLTRKAGKGQTKWYRSLLRTLTDLLASVKSIKAMGREQMAHRLLEAETQHLRRELKREALGNAALDAAQEPLYTAVLAIGIFVALTQFSIDFATVTFLALILARLLKQGGKVQKQYQKMVACKSAYWAIVDTVAEARGQAEVLSGQAPASLDEGIDLEQVDFAYGADAVLRNLSLHIPARAMTCLIGGSGTGKSTVADLIMGLMAPASGVVRIDGVPLTEIDLHGWRRRIGYVPQDNVLLHDSVRSNVTLGDESLSDADVRDALARAGALAFVDALPEGLDTVVGEHGASLSGGQRQRVMIARALAHRPSLLILDEATTALDPATEADICNKLAGLTGELTILAISHQTALRDRADRVYRIVDGYAVREPSASAAVAGG